MRLVSTSIDLIDMIERNRVDFLENLNEQARHDRQGERQADRERRSASWFGADVDRPVQRFDPALDDIHPHATAGDVGDRLRRAESRGARCTERAVARSGVRPRLAETRPFETIFLRIRSQSIPLPSSLTVITTLFPRCDAWSETVPDRGFARRLSTIGRFEAVIDRVADHVDQRVGQLVDHPLVELGLLAFDLERDLFVGRDAEVADHPMKPLEQRADRDHPGFEHALLNAVGHARELVDRLGECLDLLATLADQVELVLDRPEVLAEPPELRDPAVDAPVPASDAADRRTLRGLR